MNVSIYGYIFAVEAIIKDDSQRDGGFVTQMYVISPSEHCMDLDPIIDGIITDGGDNDTEYVIRSVQFLGKTGGIAETEEIEVVGEVEDV